MTPTRFRTRYFVYPDGGWERLPDHQQSKCRLHEQVLETKDKFKISSFDAHTLDVSITTSKKFGHVDWENPPESILFDFNFYPDRERNRTLLARSHKDEIQVLLNNKWILMFDYLSQVSKNNTKFNPNQSARFCSATSIYLQNSWWRSNGKSLRFLDLPAELRTQVYRFAAPQEAIEAFPWRGLRGGYRINAIPELGKNNRMTAALFQVNKQVYKEMRDYMFDNLPLLINHHRILNMIKDLSWFPRDQITQLILDLPTPQDFVKLFGLNGRNLITDEEFVFEGKELTTIHLSREKLPNIKKFEIIIPRRSLLEPKLRSYCQTHIGTMILEIMWDTIYGHPLVVNGMIKKWQKKHWEEKAAQAHKIYEQVRADTQDGGGVRVSQQDIDKYEGKTDLTDYDEDGNCCYCNLSCCSLHDNNSDEEDEYLFPFLCTCFYHCGEDYYTWTDEDYVKDFEEDDEDE
jgi:hypothetical protein